MAYKSPRSLEVYGDANFLAKYRECMKQTTWEARIYGLCRESVFGPQLFGSWLIPICKIRKKSSSHLSHLETDVSHRHEVSAKRASKTFWKMFVIEEENMYDLVQTNN